MYRSVVSSGTIPPLEAEPGNQRQRSDNLIIHMTAQLPKIQSTEYVTYRYRHFTEEAQEEFGLWLIMHDWGEVAQANGSNLKAEIYQKHIDEAIDTYFPLRTVTFADSYLAANIESWNKACTFGKFYSYTELYFHVFLFIYVYRLSLIHI